MPKEKKKSVARLKKEADKQFSIYIRLRDGGECITCHDGIGNQAGHFMSRRHNSTRYEEENVNGQCMRCNVFNHGEQYKYAKAVDLKYGDGTAEKLSKMAQETKQFKTWELEEIIHDAKEQIAFYQKQGA